MTGAVSLPQVLAGRYRMEREIGAGGMATVFLAYDERHERRVAVKVLRPELAAAMGPTRFLREIKITANLQHPHILPLYDSGEADGVVYYVMPFVEGESLRARLARVRQLPLDEALDIARSVAAALDYAHRHGVIHRDIKPENILLAGDDRADASRWQALVADFGVAFAVESLGSSRMTESGLTVGTPAYMSPEQASAERQPDARSDVYALGAVVYEMLVGEPPFTGPTAQSVVAKVMSERPASVRTRRDSVPLSVDTAVSRALAKVPADRFATAAQFGDALSERQPTPSEPFGGRAAHPRVRWTTAVPWLVAAAAMAAAGVTVLRSRATAPHDPLVVSTLLAPPGEEFSDRWSFGSLSPDGRRFAFVTHTSLGRSRLWVRDLDKLDARVLPGTEDAEVPFWSPDGLSVAYFAHAKLWRVEVRGGSPALVCDARSASGGSWSTDGTIYFAASDGIRRVASTGGPSNIVFRSDTNQLLVRPSISPDQRHLAFTDYTTAVLIGDVRTHAVHVVSNAAYDLLFVSPDLVTYTRDGSAHDPALYLQRVDATNPKLLGTPIQIAEQVRSAWNRMSYTVSQEGTLVYLPGADLSMPLVANRRGEVIDTIHQSGVSSLRVLQSGSGLVLSGDGGVWRYDPARRSASRLFGEEAGHGVIASRHDSLVAFHGCALDIGEMSGGKTTDEVDEKGPVCFRGSDWTPDGRDLVYWRDFDDASHKREIWTYRVADKTKTPIITGDANVAEGSVSPDGRFIAYDSDESGVFELYVRPFRRAGPAVRISTGGGRAARWRRDGRELYFASPDGHLMAVDVRLSDPPQLGAPHALFQAVGWGANNFALMLSYPFDVSADGQSFYLRQSPSYPSAVLVQHLSTLLPSSSRPQP